MATAVTSSHILDFLRRLSGRTILSMSSVIEPAATATAAEGEAPGSVDSTVQNGHNGHNGHNRHNGLRWRRDRLSFFPLNDRGGPVSLSPSADSALGTLAQIELNDRNGREPDFGLKPGQLDDPNSP